MKKLVVLIGFLIILAGTAWASIPDSNGVIHGCYRTSNPAKGAVIVIDSDTGEVCPSGTLPLNWNQTGPQGPTGATGPAGTTGPGEILISLVPNQDTEALYQLSTNAVQSGCCVINYHINGSGGGADWRFVPASNTALSIRKHIHSVLISAASYPSTVQFSLEVAFDFNGNTGGDACVRLYDLTSDSPVIGSDFCSSPVAGGVLRTRGPSFLLDPSLHEYVIQVQCIVPNSGASCTAGYLLSASIVVNW